MGTPRSIKRHLTLVNNIGKITKALEMVSTSKIQKLKKRALNFKPFTEAVYQLTQVLSLEEDTPSTPLLKISKKSDADLYILITTNRGLIGNLNTNLLRFLNNLLKQSPMPKHKFITLGEKGRSFAHKNGELTADFSEIVPMESVIPSLVTTIINHFIEKGISEVYLVFNNFISVFSQIPSLRKILPLTLKEISNSQKNISKSISNNQITGPKKFTFEPSYQDVLKKILPFYLETQITEAIIQAETSEHAARMIVMRNASDNALDLYRNLCLEFNKARQQEITSEINDIVSAGFLTKE